MGFPIINLWGAHFTSTFSVFSVMAACRDTFHAVLCLYCYVTNSTKLRTKHTGLSVFQSLILEACITHSFLQSGSYMQHRKKIHISFSFYSTGNVMEILCSNFLHISCSSTCHLFGLFPVIMYCWHTCYISCNSTCYVSC